MKAILGEGLSDGSRVVSFTRGRERFSNEESKHLIGVLGGLVGYSKSVFILIEGYWLLEIVILYIRGALETR